MRRPTRAVFPAVIALGLVAAGPVAGSAQDASPTALPPPLRVVHIEGEATLVRDGAAVEPGPNTPLIEGDRFRTADGRAELGLPRGALIFLDRHSALDLRAVNRVRLLDGRIRLASPNSSEPPDIVIDAPGATLTPSSVTSFLLEASAGPRGDEVVLRVEDGVVEFASDRDSMLIRAGESVSLRAGGTPTTGSGYARAERSEFDVWVGERLRAYQPQATAASASYLPGELGGYSAALGQYGSWDYEPDYGHVWYPNVAVDWRPYSVGYWDRVGAYGQFWIGYDPWAWPTHHYGRWGYRGGRWFWAPGTVWGPAWVSWSVGPGYVGWCPLGYNNLPVFGFGVGFGAWGGSYHSASGYDYWRGWSVVPSYRFHGYRRPYGSYYVDPRRLSHETRSAFVTQRVPPNARRGNYAVPRYGTPRGSVTGSEAYDRARPYIDGRNGMVGGPSSRGTEAYDRARPYMDRNRVPGATGAPSGSGAGSYERARPFMNPGTTPGLTRPRGDQSGGSMGSRPQGTRQPDREALPRGGWGQTPRAQPEAPTGQPPASGRSWGTGTPRSSAPGAEANRPRAYEPPRSYERPPSGREAAPRSYSPPRGSAPARDGGTVRFPSTPRPESGRSSWGSGPAAPRSMPRASSPGRGSSGGGMSAPSRGGSATRSRSPRG